MTEGEPVVRAFELDVVERWIQAVITDPAGVVSGIQSDAARVLGLPASVEEVVVSSAMLPALERLTIYSRAYRVRLVECLRSAFPVLRYALGDDLFSRFAADYVDSGHACTLERLAADFAQHLADTRPGRNGAPDEREQWPDFIIDLAALESAFLAAFDGPGLEDDAPLSAADVLAIPTTALADTRPIPAPCLHLLVTRYPVHDYLLACRRGMSPEHPAPARRFVALTRRNYRVGTFELRLEEYRLLSLLDGHRTLGEALRRYAVVCGDQRPDPPVRSWLCDWATKGFLRRVA